MNQRKFKLQLSILIMLFLISCNSNKDGVDCIQISPKEFECNYEEKDINISTYGNDWWLGSYVDIDGVQTSINDLKVIREEGKPDNFPPISIEGKWFFIEKKYPKGLTIHLNENTTKEKRELIIPVQLDDYYDHVKVIQGAK